MHGYVNGDLRLVSHLSLKVVIDGLGVLLLHHEESNRSSTDKGSPSKIECCIALVLFDDTLVSKSNISMLKSGTLDLCSFCNRYAIRQAVGQVCPVLDSGNHSVLDSFSVFGELLFSLEACLLEEAYHTINIDALKCVSDRHVRTFTLCWFRDVDRALCWFSDVDRALLIL